MLVALGLKSGRVAFIDVKGLKIIIVEALALTRLAEEEEVSYLNLEVADMAWDLGEDHLLVVNKHGQIGMIDFNGFAAGDTKWRFAYETQKTGNDTV